MSTKTFSAREGSSKSSMKVGHFIDSEAVEALQPIDLIRSRHELPGKTVESEESNDLKKQGTIAGASFSTPFANCFLILSACLFEA